MLPQVAKKAEHTAIRAEHSSASLRHLVNVFASTSTSKLEACSNNGSDLRKGKASEGGDA
jgi:hypothetical protein